MDFFLLRGFWIFYNNFFFLFFSENKFVEFGGKVWKEIIIGDIIDNVFYICILVGSVILKNLNLFIFNYCSYFNIFFFNYLVKKKRV